MLKLTTIHLDDIQKYFLASSEEEKSHIQQNIKPQYLSAFLDDLKFLFNSKLFNEVEFFSIAKSMGAEAYIERLKEIQRDYYVHLAVIHLSGIKNTDVDLLIKNQNSFFLEELSFQQDFNSALVFYERKQLKNRFKAQDKQTDIQQEEIELALKLNERKRLKSLFQKIDSEQQIIVPETVAANYNYQATSSNAAFSINWKKYAIAAAIIGLFSTTTFIIFNNNGIKSVASNKQLKEPLNKDLNKQVLTDSQLWIKNKKNNEATQILARETKAINIKNVNVLTAEFGFATVKKNLSLKIYNLANRINLLEKLDVSIDDSIKIKINAEILVLKSKLNRYSFINDTISIYINKSTNVEIIATDKKYFMQLGKTIYECNPTKKLIPLQIVEDEAKLEKVQRVLFKNNKLGK